jgi:2-polyprenyl-6-methoxyphenol hydroxylase-like FAD-dependent oxidoreductase
MNGAVAVVGGSIGGSTAAVELARAGFDVEIFERSEGNLLDRGAGIGLSVSFLDRMERRDLIDPGMPSFRVSKRRFVVRSGERLGRTLWEQRIAFAMTSWGVLYRELRRRVPDERFHSGHDVVRIVDDGRGRVSIETTAGRRRSFDLVVAADGYESSTRRLLFPEAKLAYAGYSLWRGFLDERLVPDVSLFDDALTYAAYRGGHGPLYFVPSRDGDVEPGRRRLNWGVYAAMDGPPAPVVPGGASRAQVERVRRLGTDEMPGYVAEVIAATEEPFLQPIYDLRVPSYRRGRVCLLGDAATVARPHTAGGVEKAVADAIALAEALRAGATIDGALETWNRERSAVGHDLVTLGEALGRALVTEVPDWAAMGSAEMDAWWDRAIHGHTWYPVAEAANAPAGPRDGRRS